MSETTTDKPDKTPPQPGTEGTGVCLTGEEKPKTENAPTPKPAGDK